MIRTYAAIQAMTIYVPLFAVRILLIISGLAIVPIAYLFRSNRKFPRWAWIWDNDEDGIYGPEWFNKGHSTFILCYMWSAIRNPANNMRHINMFNVTHASNLRHYSWGHFDTPEPKLSRQTKSAIWHFTLVQQGGLWFFSWWYIRALTDEHHFRIRAGWKCTPSWIVKPRSPAYKDSGICFQFLPYRRG